MTRVLAARLVREGRSPEDIALTFGLTELQVKRTLALGTLLPRIRTLYRNGEIDVSTARHLSVAQQAVPMLHKTRDLLIGNVQRSSMRCGHICPSTASLPAKGPTGSPR